jgi:hypothetical protein
MTPRVLSTLAVLLVGLVACSGQRRLETTMGGRPLEYLQAEARKIDGQWWCELRLPLGQWRVETEEGQTFDLLPGEPRATLRWKVAPDRWVQQDRPFRFDLVGENGLRLSLSVRYPHTLPKAAEAVLQVFRGSLPL